MTKGNGWITKLTSCAVLLMATAAMGQEFDQYKLIELKPKLTIKAGHKIVKRVWRADTLDFRAGETFIGTGPPGKHRVTVEIDTAETYMVDVGGEAKEAILLPIETHTETWDITIQGARPPPEEEKPEKPEGAKTTAIVYPDLSPRPLQAVKAAEDLRKEGETVFLFPRGSAPTTASDYLGEAVKEADKVGLPALVIMRDSQVVHSAKLPDTSKEIVDVVTNN